MKFVSGRLRVAVITVSVLVLAVVLYLANHQPAPPPEVIAPSMMNAHQDAARSPMWWVLLRILVEGDS